MKQQLLWMLLLRVVFYTMLAGINLLFLDPRFVGITIPVHLLILFILIVYLITIGSAVLLMRSEGEYRRFGFLQTLVDVAFASILVYLSGASQSIYTSVFFFPIIAAGLLIPIKGGLIGAAASTLLYAFILVLEFLGYLPNYLLLHTAFQTPNPFVSVNLFATRGLTFFLAAFVSAMFGARLKKTTEELSSKQSDYDRLSFLYKQIFDNISTGIITIDGNGIITSANNAVHGITLLSITEMVGKPLAAIIPSLDLSRTSPRNACDFVRSDKQKIRIGYAHAALNSPQQDDQDGDRAPEDDIVIVSLRDIGEIERLEAQMRQAEKLAAIGMMSAGIAHDFRNPLAAISGSAQILAQELSSAVPVQQQNYELTKIILRESDRLAKTITDFLKFARPDNIDREWFQLRPCIEDIMQVCKADPKWPASCVVDIDIDTQYRIWADEKQLFTVLSHCINNGVAFCLPGKEHIAIQALDIERPSKTMMSCLSISDNGPGITPEEAKQIFEPFYTTRPDGTGLGLAIVRQTIEAHGGSILVDASEIGGTRFRIFLPLPEESN
jgi:two-component system sensor histidine kinase PilS (NtrC family)